MKQKLTKKQEDALKGIEAFIAENGYSPTNRELAKALGYQSSSTVHALLDKLAEKSYISKETDGARTIRILKEQNESSKHGAATGSAQFARMEAALKNILDISTDDFARHQARYGLGIDK